MAEAQPSGVRVVFRTSARNIELDVLPTKMAYQGAPPRPDGVYDLLVDGRLAAQGTAPGGNVRTMDVTTGAATTERGPVGTRPLRDAGGRRRRTSRSGCRTTRSPL